MFSELPSARPEYKFKAVYFIHTPKENLAHYRPLIASFDDEIERRLLTASGNCMDLSEGALTSVAGSIIQPSRVSQGVVGIVNGWDSSRFAFFIEAEVSRGGRIYREAYQGYTDHLGVSGFGNNQNLDQSMRLTVNSRSILKIMGDSRSREILPSKLTNQLSTVGITDLSYNTNHVTESMRPGDVLAASARSLSHIKADQDTRTIITSATTAADSEDLRANHFLSDTFNSYKQALERREHAWEDESSTLANARGYAAKVDNTSASVLSTIQSTVGFDKDSTFTYGELISVFPEIDLIKNVSVPVNGVIEDRTTEFEDMGGSNLEASIAFSLGHLLPNVLFQASLATVDMLITNRSINGTLKAGIIDCEPMYSINTHFESRRMRLVNRVENELMALLFDVDQTAFTIKVKTSILAASHISIDIGNGERRYRVPNYCSSLSSPMMSVGNELDTLADKLKGTFETIRSEAGNLY